MIVNIPLSPFVELPAKGGGVFSIALSHIVAIGEHSDGMATVFAGGGSGGDAFYLSCTHREALTKICDALNQTLSTGKP